MGYLDTGIQNNQTKAIYSIMGLNHVLEDLRGKGVRLEVT